MNANVAVRRMPRQRSAVACFAQCARAGYLRRATVTRASPEPIPEPLDPASRSPQPHGGGIDFGQAPHSRSPGEARAHARRGQAILGAAAARTRAGGASSAAGRSTYAAARSTTWTAPSWRDEHVAVMEIGDRDAP